MKRLVRHFSEQTESKVPTWLRHGYSQALKQTTEAFQAV